MPILEKKKRLGPVHSKGTQSTVAGLHFFSLFVVYIFNIILHVLLLMLLPFFLMSWKSLKRVRNYNVSFGRKRRQQELWSHSQAALDATLHHDKAPCVFKLLFTIFDRLLIVIKEFLTIIPPRQISIVVIFPLEFYESFLGPLLLLRMIGNLEQLSGHRPISPPTAQCSIRSPLTADSGFTIVVVVIIICKSSNELR